MLFNLLTKLVLIFSLRAEANSALSFENAPESVKHEWRRLLHFSGDHSKVASDEFFLSKERTLSAEWKASLKAIDANSVSAGFFEQPVACTFVARRRFFEKLGLLPSRDYRCRDYQEWREGVDPKGVALIFSSYYPNNPASHFGHTFLRLKKGRFENDLLDYAISYSAIVPANEPSALYAIRGIFGGYRGHFDFAPYYTMVGIYNNNESRDLLEYDLGFNQEETNRLVDHVWELYSSGSFTYYFLDENCSSVLGGLLEYAKLDWNLSEGDRWYYLPSELVRRVASAIGSPKREARPSLKKQAELRASLLTSKERTEFNDRKPSEYSVPMLDAKLAELQFLKFKSKNQLTPFQAKLFKDLLTERARRVGELTPKLNYETTYPEAGHLPRALMMGFARTNSESEVVIGIKEGYHHLYDSDVGLAEYSGFDFFDIRARYNFDQQKLRLDRLRIIDIYSAHPMSALDPQASWHLVIGRERAYEAGAQLLYRHEAKAAVGASWIVSSHLFSALGGIHAQHSKASYKEGGLGVWLSAEAIFALGPKIKWATHYEQARDFTSDFERARRSFVQSTLALNLAQNFALHLWGRYDEAKIWGDSKSMALEVVGRF